MNHVPDATRTCRLCNGEPIAPWPPTVGGGPTHHTCYPGEERGTIVAMPRGRPPQDGTRRDSSIRVLAHSEQIAVWREAAEREGLDLSTWVREALDDAAAKRSR